MNFNQPDGQLCRWSGIIGTYVSVSLIDREMYIGMQTASPDVLAENVATARKGRI